MEKIILIGILIFIFIFESLFCKIMKRKDEKRLKSLKQSNIRENETYKLVKKKSVVKKEIYKIIDDFTFLFFKIVGYIPCHKIRKLFYKYIFCMDIDKNVVIYYALEARAPWNISISQGTIIGDHAIFDARNGIEIGKNVNFSTGVWMWTLQHDVNSSTFSTEGKGGKIVIEDRVWVSSRTSILPGVTLAEGVVVAAGAVVTKSIKTTFSIYGGVPAKNIGYRNSQLLYEFDGRHRSFI